jgi:hypothetical protein
VSLNDDFDEAIRLLQNCRDDFHCYAQLLRQSAPRQTAGFASIKAAAMAAVFGSADRRPELVELLSITQDPAVRFVLIQAIDHLSPAGAPSGLLARLEALTEQQRSEQTYAATFHAAPTETLYLRLRLRGQ